MINSIQIAEKPISLVTIDSPYMLFKFFEGTGASVFAETNIAGATLEYPITNGGGINWSTKALAFTPDTTADTYIDDVDADVADEDAVSPLESLLRVDDAFGTIFIAFTCSADVNTAPAAAEDFLGMGDNQIASNSYMALQQSTSGDIQLRLYNGDTTTLDLTNIAFANFTQSENNTFLFAINKTSGNQMGFVNGASSAIDTTTNAAGYPITPPITAGRETKLFARSPNGVPIEVLNNEAVVRIMSVDNMLIVKSATELTASKLQSICDGLNEYKGDKPWALDGI